MKFSIRYLFFMFSLACTAQSDANGQLTSAKNFSKLSRSELDSEFILAIKTQDSETVKSLLQAGANIDCLIPFTYSSGDCDWTSEITALEYAVRNNDHRLIKELIKYKKDLNFALDLAIKEGFSEAVNELILGGADINYANHNQDTPLFIAIKYARASAEYSLQAQEKTQSRWSHRRKIIDSLLKAGADPIHVNNVGKTALMEAINQHDLYTVQKILEMPEMHKGYFFGFLTKPINYADHEGNTALIHALLNACFSYTNNQQYQICLKSQAIINILLNTQDIDLYHQNNKGESALTLFDKLNKKINSY